LNCAIIYFLQAKGALEIKKPIRRGPRMKSKIRGILSVSNSRPGSTRAFLRHQKECCQISRTLFLFLSPHINILGGLLHHFFLSQLVLLSKIPSASLDVGWVLLLHPINDPRTIISTCPKISLVVIRKLHPGIMPS
jgi:hypothetical protein